MMAYNKNLSSEFKDVLDFLKTDPYGIYSQSLNRIREDFGTEQVTLAGGYAYRQITELIQNGADAISEQYLENKADQSSTPRIEVILTKTHLYVGNTGAPLSKDGLRALLTANSSPKRGSEIGRFGLGFKSLLRLGGKIAVYSATNGNIYFDPVRCRREICKDFNVENAPGLRLAWPLDCIEHQEDSIIEEIGTWAETLIKAEIKAGDCLLALKTEMEKFEEEFLLFLPVSVKITFKDLTDDPEKTKELEVENVKGFQKRLVSEKGESLWLCFTKDITITDPLAISDATHIHQRETVPIAWAYPMEGRVQSGHFWAFFSTSTNSYIAGILNAPWKLNSDRTAIVPGAWNIALFEQTIELISQNLSNIIRADDPGSVLDAFPRQIENQSEIAKPLVDNFWKSILSADIIPDGNGTPRHPYELSFPPTDEIELIKTWNEIATYETKCNYIHSSCFGRDRKSRLEECRRRLKENEEKDNKQLVGNLVTAEYKLWIESIARTELEYAKKVLCLADACSQKMKVEDWNKLKSTLQIIPSSDGKQLLSANKAIIASGNIPTERIPVLEGLVEDAIIRKILINLGIKEIDESLWLETLKRTLPDKAEGDWDRFWQNFRKCPESVIDNFIHSPNIVIYVKRNDGQWVLPNSALLPGKWIDTNDEQNRKWLVDFTLHGEDTLLLDKIGVKEEYIGATKLSATNELFRDWRKENKFSDEKHFRDENVIYDCESNNYYCPISVSWILKLEGNAKKLATDAAFSLIIQDANKPQYSHQYTKMVSVSYTYYGPNGGVYRGRQSQKYNPVLWLILKKGVLSVRENMVPVSVIVSRKNHKGIIFFPEWNILRLVLEKLDIPQGYVPESEYLLTLWDGIISEVVTNKDISDPNLSVLWRDAANDGLIPKTLPDGINGSNVPISEINVTSSSRLADAAHRNNIMTILLDSATLEKWCQVGAHDIADDVDIAINNMGEQVDVREILPELISILNDNDHRYPCRLVSEIIQNIKGKRESLSCLAYTDELLLSNNILKNCLLKERLDKIIPEMIGLGWCTGDWVELISKIINTDLVNAREKVKGKINDSLSDRLFRAVGIEALRNEIINYIGGEENFIEIAKENFAELALNQFGPAVLSIFQESLEKNGLKPPKRWNTDEARRFVTEIGFPIEFAASSQQKREAEEFVSGPLDLPKLHDFQEEVMQGIRSLIPRDKFRRRAVVSLPTGGGKTRVTVQAAVELILKPDDGIRSVVWIAQTDELCEQAVQAFKQVWVNIGAQGLDLLIIRLWGGQRNPDPQPSDKPLVVVASIQTLNNRFEGLEWLSSPGLIVMDECHHAITPSYTNILHWLDAGAPRPGQQPHEEPPIIGLSATPFRTNDEESSRLAKRFDNTWFPKDQESLYQHLLRQEVLSKIKTDALDSDIPLTTDEIYMLERLESNNELDKPTGFTALQRIDERFSNIKERNDLIVGRIRRALENKDAKSVLLFANSVMHARKLSVLLNFVGIPSSSIDGGTPKNARRYLLEKFQRNEIKVLCNHSVLTTGFDAPKTDMILISRTIFSPVMYMQIVGRGLRGPKNGGTPECLLVTVNDNLGRFANHYAYHYCKNYFDQMQSTIKNT
ncbi:hypothetical protein AGMMS49546_04580 [Spirochaetia bacterium]|nr:hypothetical protein AGMMS49546_04580 [Spirochaetia bacterium]